MVPVRLVVDFILGGIVQYKALLDENGKAVLNVACAQVGVFYNAANRKAAELRKDGEYSLNSRSVSRAKRQGLRRLRGHEDGVPGSTYRRELAI